MAAGREIRNKIRSIRSTQKITKAMQMVATSKMRKTQDKMLKARPYAENIRKIIAHLANTDYNSVLDTPFLAQKDSSTYKTVGLFLITSDKGLCGGLNANVLKKFYEEIIKWNGKKVNLQIGVIGNKGLAACNRLKLDIVSSGVNLGDQPEYTQIIQPLDILLKNYYNGSLDALYIIYNAFQSTMKQTATIEQLLPLTKEVFIADENDSLQEYLYESEPIILFNELLKRYIESVVYQCMLDNIASEQAARMLAMRSATENADSAIDSLTLLYNKSRQAAITKELAEIMSGAAAV